jgi:hypothetical protein
MIETENKKLAQTAPTQKGGDSCSTGSVAEAENPALRNTFSGKNPALRVAAELYT